MNSNIKLLVVGPCLYSFYENDFCEALNSRNIHAKYFRLPDLFPGFYEKISYYFSLPTPRKNQALEALIDHIAANNYSHILIWRALSIRPVVIKKLKSLGISCCIYTNDSPYPRSRLVFYSWFLSLRWSSFASSMKHADLCAFYRISDINRCHLPPSIPTTIMMPACGQRLYSSYKESPVKRYGITFVGHYEDDGRDLIAQKLFLNGLDTHIFSTSKWRAIRARKKHGYFMHDPVFGEKYIDVLLSSTLLLCFFSALNCDYYTRRVFEAAALGVPSICLYNPVIATIFEDGKEIILCRSADEIFVQASQLVNHPVRCLAIGKMARERSLRSGYSLESRSLALINYWVSLRRTASSC